MNAIKKSLFVLLLLSLLLGLCLFWVTAQNHSIATHSQTDGHYYEDGQVLIGRISNGVTPSLVKQVWNEEKEGGADWDAYTACGIGESVSFQVFASIPDDYAQYSTYSFTITDELSEGFVYENNSVKICFNEAGSTDITEHFMVSVEDGILTIHCEDIHKVICLAPKNRVVIRYRATLGQDAVLGGAGNLNRIYMDHSNDPNWNGKGEEPMGRVFSNQIGVFSFRLDIQKVDVGTQLPVSGAEFVLLNEAGEYLSLNRDSSAAGWFSNQKPSSTLTIDENGQASVIGLRPGTYYLKEIKAPKGYHSLEEPIQIVLSAQYEDTAQGLRQVSGLTLQVDGGESVSSNSPAKDRVEVKVENLYGTILPPTGGIGTTAYYIIGIVILFTVALFYAAKRSIREQ